MCAVRYNSEHYNYFHIVCTIRRGCRLIIVWDDKLVDLFYKYLQFINF